MGAKHHRELEVWQLANRLRRSFHEICTRPAVRSDHEFRGQTSRSARSACRNIAEGFWRFGHREFAHFVNIAKGSLGELCDSADEALLKAYITDDEYAELNRVLDHALRATNSLHSHLSNTPTPEQRPRRRRRARRKPPQADDASGPPG